MPLNAKYPGFKSRLVHIHQADVVIGIVRPAFIPVHRGCPVDGIFGIEGEPVIPAFVVETPSLAIEEVFGGNP